MSVVWDRMVTGVLVLAAVSMSAAVVKRELTPSGPIPLSKDPVKTKEWPQILKNGTRIGPDAAPVVIAEFTDYQCPFCKKWFEEVYLPIAGRYPGKIAFVAVDFPITGHRAAVPSARAASCANKVNAIEPFIRALFAHQLDLESANFARIASAVGIADTVAFNRCLKTGVFTSVDSGLAIGKRMGVRGTPTVVINGWHLPSAPSDSSLTKIIERILQGRDVADK